MSVARGYKQTEAHKAAIAAAWTPEHREAAAARGRARRIRDETPREKKLRQRFGMTLLAYEALLDEQGGVCAICQQPEAQVHHATGEFSLLAVDHDHNSGKVRGLLCRQCNLGIGNLGDDVNRLRSALRYLTQETL